MEDEHPVLSRSALEALHAELEELKVNGRQEMGARLKHARELGDVTDNAAFESAKQDQAMMEGRIAHLERIVKDAVVREGPADASNVAVGVIVTVRDTEEGLEDSFVIAESAERASGARVLSPKTPLGQALLGKTIGDQVTYEAPGGTFTYEIVSLEAAT